MTFLLLTRMFCQSVIQSINKQRQIVALTSYHKNHTYMYWYSRYRKFPKYSDTQKICCNHTKLWTMWLCHRVMSPNVADGMANSVDPDQTAPLGAVWSGSALFSQTCLPKTFENNGMPGTKQVGTRITGNYANTVGLDETSTFCRILTGSTVSMVTFTVIVSNGPGVIG